MDNDAAGFSVFLMGILLATTIIFGWFTFSSPTIEYQELYRFCLAKDIPLEGCIIPRKPYEPKEE